MTDLHTALLTSAAAVKQVKEEVVGTPKGPDVETFVHVYRDGQSIAALSFPAHREFMLRVLMIVVTGLAADMFTVSFETYGSPEVINPRTGKEWEHGEQQQLVQDDPSVLAEGIVVEQILSLAISREGGFEAILQPYRIEGSDLVWGEMSQTSGDEGMHGSLVEAIRELFAEPTMADQLEVVNMSMPKLTQASHLRILTIAEVTSYDLLTQMGHISLHVYCERDSLRESELKHALRRQGMESIHISPN